MAGLNRVVLVGRLVRDPELRKTNSGTSVTSFTIAVDNLTRKGEEKTTSYIPCTCWSMTAENVAKYCSKGSLVGIDGRISQRSYEDKNGQKRSIVEVVAENVQFLESKNSNKNNDNSSMGNGTDFVSDAVSHEGIDGSDDDLPF